MYSKLNEVRLNVQSNLLTFFFSIDLCRVPNCTVVDARPYWSWGDSSRSTEGSVGNSSSIGWLSTSYTVTCLCALGNGRPSRSARICLRVMSLSSISYCRRRRAPASSSRYARRRSSSLWCLSSRSRTFCIFWISFRNSCFSRILAFLSSTMSVLS